MHPQSSVPQAFFAFFFQKNFFIRKPTAARTAVKTNILGAENVMDAAIYNNVKRVIILSTDKACYPINAMGMSKAMMEKVAVAKSRSSNGTTINVTRYGNVMCSRGSVIPLFINQIESGGPVTVTDKNILIKSEDIFTCCKYKTFHFYFLKDYRFMINKVI